MKLQFGAGEVSDARSAAIPGEASAREADSLSTSSTEPSFTTSALISSEDAVEAPPTSDDSPSEEFAPRVAVSSTRICRDGYAVTFVAQDAYQRRYVPIQRLRTRAHSVQRYEFETTGRTELQIAFTGASGYYAGGFTKSRVEQNSVGMRWTQQNRLRQVLRPEWEYRQFRSKCYRTSGYNISSYWSGTYQWRPNRLTTGGKLAESEASWTCARTVQMPVETWVARSSTVSWDNWFSVGTVKLDSRQSNTASHKLTVIPDAGERAPRICGDTGYPDESHRIKERVDT